MLGQNNFSNQKQIELLQILNFVVCKKCYPQDTCGILEKKILILQQPTDAHEKDNPQKSETKRTQKVTTDVLLALLQKSGISAVSDDKTKMSRLISYLSNYSEEKVRQRLSNTEELTSYHREEVETINKILAELNCDISIKCNKRR